MICWSVRLSVHWYVGRPSVVRPSVTGYQAHAHAQSAILRRLPRAAACSSARLICIMKSSRNAFCVNSGRIAYDCRLIIVDPNKIKTHFFATASQISHTSRFIRCLFLKKKPPRVFLLKEVNKFDRILHVYLNNKMTDYRIKLGMTFFGT